MSLFTFAAILIEYRWTCHIWGHWHQPCDQDSCTQRTLTTKLPDCKGCIQHLGQMSQKRFTEDHSRRSYWNCSILQEEVSLEGCLSAIWFVFCTLHLNLRYANEVFAYIGDIIVRNQDTYFSFSVSAQSKWNTGFVKCSTLLKPDKC